MVGPDECPHFIPLARRELTELFCAEPALSADERTDVRKLADLVAAHYHFVFDRRFVDGKLRGLLHLVLSTPEYQLS